MLSRRVKTLITNYLASRGLYLSPASRRSPDPWADIAETLGWHPFNNFIDVGANTGQSIEAMLRFQPNARIWAIEPNAEVFEQLRATFGGNPRIDFSNLAMGAANGQGTLNVTRTSSTSYLERSDGSRPMASEEIAAQQTVVIQTLDAFCEQKKIEGIDYLKIDAEGADLDVLRGADRMLSGGYIFLVECECGMHPGNKVHVPFETIKSCLEARGYHTFGIYEQSSEWLERKPFLRRVNAIFLLNN